MKVHLLDGTYELFRMFFGAPEAKSKAGVDVGATRGLLRTFAFLVDDPEVTHVGVAFDHVIESFRNDLYDGYKTGAGIDPALWAQFPLAERAAAAFGFVVWPMVEFEADDALASAAATFGADPTVDQVVIATPDKDLCQCVRGDEVVLWDRRRGIVLNEDGVLEKHGVPPASIPDLLALMGDSADGIPGIARWGKKSAAQVLKHYGHIASIPDDPADWSVKVRGAATLAQNLAGQREDAELYRTLATLRTDVPLGTDLAQLEWRGADEPALRALAEEIGDASILDRVRRFR